MNIENRQRRNAAYTITADVLEVLMQFASGVTKHEAWCFKAEDDDDLEQQLSGNEVQACPVCCAVFEIQKEILSQDARSDQNIEEIKNFFHGYSK